MTNPIRPRARKTLLERNRLELRRDALAVLALAGGEMEGVELARRLGIPDRAPRMYFGDDPVFSVLTRDNGHGRGSVWVSINPAAIRRPEHLPPLLPPPAPRTVRL
jgi:hypothetical protein